MSIGALSSATLTSGAADLPSTKSAPAAVYAPPLFTWSGFYVGGSVGYTAAHNTVTHYSTGDGCWWDCGQFKDSGQGVIGGINAGYNYQMGSVVVGLEADMSALSSTGTLNTYCDNTGPYCDYTQRTRVSALGTVRGRALLYVTGGLAYGHVSNYVKDNNDPGYWNGSKWRAGYALGAGLEYAVTNNWTIKAEGLYYDLGHKTITFVQTTDGPSSLYPARFKTSGVIVRLGVNYKF